MKFKKTSVTSQKEILKRKKKIIKIRKNKNLDKTAIK